jgi:hypothetical protein
MLGTVNTTDWKVFGLGGEAIKATEEEIESDSEPDIDQDD